MWRGETRGEEGVRDIAALRAWAVVRGGVRPGAYCCVTPTRKALPIAMGVGAAGSVALGGVWKGGLGGLAVCGSLGNWQ